MISKTFIIGFLVSAIPQVVSFIEGQTPALTALVLSVSPDWLDPLLVGVIPLVSSWVVAMLVTLTRNDAVKTGTKASPLTGAKALWKK